MKDEAVSVVDINPKYRKDNGLFLLDIEQANFPSDFKAIEKSLLVIPAGQMGGNHAHSRREVFIGVGNGLEIFWLDGEKELNSATMNPDGQLKLFFVNSLVPHAVRNTSESQAVLIEYTDLPQDQSSYESVHVI